MKIIIRLILLLFLTQLHSMHKKKILDRKVAPLLLTRLLLDEERARVQTYIASISADTPEHYDLLIDGIIKVPHFFSWRPVAQLIGIIQRPRGKEALNKLLDTQLEKIPGDDCRSALCIKLHLLKLVEGEIERDQSAAHVLDLCLCKIEEKKGVDIKQRVLKQELTQNSYTNNMTTLLIKAVHAHNFYCAKVLLEHQANPNQYTKHYLDRQMYVKAPLEEYCDRSRLQKLLISFGAKVTMVKTDYDYITGSYHYNVVQYDAINCDGFREQAYLALFETKNSYTGHLPRELHNELLKYLHIVW